MTSTSLTHFELKCPPSSKEVSDADLWLPPSKKSLVEELTEAMHNRGSVILTGEPGVGKTCVLRALRHRLPAAGFRLTYRLAAAALRESACRKRKLVERDVLARVVDASSSQEAA